VEVGDVKLTGPELKFSVFQYAGETKIYCGSKNLRHKLRDGAVHCFTASEGGSGGAAAAPAAAAAAAAGSSRGAVEAAAAASTDIICATLTMVSDQAPSTMEFSRGHWRTAADFSDPWPKAASQALIKVQLRGPRGKLSQLWEQAGWISHVTGPAFGREVPETATCTSAPDAARASAAAVATAAGAFPIMAVVSGSDDGFDGGTAAIRSTASATKREICSFCRKKLTMAEGESCFHRSGHKHTICKVRVHEKQPQPVGLRKDGSLSDSTEVRACIGGVQPVNKTRASIDIVIGELTSGALSEAEAKLKHGIRWRDKKGGDYKATQLLLHGLVRHRSLARSLARE
jgi:hypothetical protein